MALVDHAAPGRPHGWEGKLYVVLNYLGAALFAFSGIIFLLLPLTSEPRVRDTAQPGLMLLAFGGMTALCVACARGVRGFRAWGWWLATLISGVSVLTCLAALFVPTQADPSSTRVGALFVIAFHALFLRYFLARRRDFGIGF